MIYVVDCKCGKCGLPFRKGVSAMRELVVCPWIQCSATGYWVVNGEKMTENCQACGKPMDENGLAYGSYTQYCHNRCYIDSLRTDMLKEIVQNKRYHSIAPEYVQQVLERKQLEEAEVLKGKTAPY